MSEYFRKPIVKTLMLKGQEGQSIKGIKKTNTSGLVDTYTIMFNDGTTSTFTVTNGEGIQNLKVGGRNLIIKRDLKNGWLSNDTGEIINTDPQYTNTDYIPLKSGETFTISWEKDGSLNDKWYGIYYINSDKKVIKYYYSQVHGNSFIKTDVAPDQCAYLRVYWQGSKDEKVKIERGNIATDWTPAPEDLKLESYPVGSIYMSTVSTSPAELFGGTWEEITGRFLLAHDESHPAASTGGEYQHVLTLTELPQDVWQSNATIQVNGVKGAVDSGSFYGMCTKGDNFNQPHNNTPPYLAVYMWKRIA